MSKIYSSRDLHLRGIRRGKAMTTITSSKKNKQCRLQEKLKKDIFSILEEQNMKLCNTIDMYHKLGMDMEQAIEALVYVLNKTNVVPKSDIVKRFLKSTPENRMSVLQELVETNHE